jgi:hypothetical protein
MKNELEDNFGLALQQLVAHLIKNSKQVPEPVLQTALDWEAATWSQLDDATKRTRVRAVAEQTEAPSAVNRYMEAYPHPFTKKRYVEYLEALRLYKQSLNA